MRSKEVHVWIKHESNVFVFPFCFLLNDFQLLFIYPRGETDLDKPLIKGLPRYKKAECIPRRTYSDLCSMFLKIVLLSRLLLLVESRFG